MYPVLKGNSIHRDIQPLSEHQREGRPVAQMVSPGAINGGARGYGRAYDQTFLPACGWVSPASARGAHGEK